LTNNYPKPIKACTAPLIYRFQQEFARRALSNNYSRPIIGVPEDFEGLGRVEVGSG
jgi:hypothetical protein